MSMGDKSQGELPHSVAEQKRNHHPATRVGAVGPGAGVDEHPPPRRCAEDRRISLPDVEKM
jgi:hypothetical protein